MSATPTITQDFEALQEAVNSWCRSEGGHAKQAALGRIAASHAELVAAHAELVAALKGLLACAIAAGADCPVSMQRARTALAKADAS